MKSICQDISILIDGEEYYAIRCCKLQSMKKVNNSIIITYDEIYSSIIPLIETKTIIIPLVKGLQIKIE